MRAAELIAPALIRPTADVMPARVAYAVGIEVTGLDVRARGRVLVDGAHLSVAPGELVAVAGASGAGKSTLLEAVAGLRSIAGGSVRFVRRDGTSPSEIAVGFVPQDDIIHRDLPLRTSLCLAARLRLAGSPSWVEIEAIVDATMARLELLPSADVRVGSLSGGQRKRASIATELLADPDVVLLDEPTSGLDPATATEVMRTLRALAESGTTVVFTTHGLTDLDWVDRMAFVAPGGRVAFFGTTDEARREMGSPDLADLYVHFARDGRRDRVRRTEHAEPAAVQPARRASAVVRTRRASVTRQWLALTRRTVALLTANRLTMAIMFGAPAVVVAMMAILFPAGAAADPATQPTTAVQSVFWVAFAGFFFGLTAGLLQIVPEAAIVRREHFAGVRSSVYVLAKVTALAPVLVVVTVGMLGVLHVTDRLPTASTTSVGALLGVVLLESLSALALGLLASAAVRDAAQATLALPMLCFPQVLFGGAIVAVPAMAAAGRFLSYGMATRWGFDGIGRSLGLGEAVTFDGDLAPFERAFTGSLAGPAVVLGAITIGLLAMTALVVHRRSR